MGQSAGASPILHHITAGCGSDEYRPYFNEAILESPAFFPKLDPQVANEVFE
jgi:hypothetical protein